MADFTLPELGEGIESGDVLRVLVALGDRIARDQPVLELETDKATIEVPSSVAGTVRDIKVKAGDTVKVGQLILTVEAGTGETVAGTRPVRTDVPAPNVEADEQPAVAPGAATEGRREEAPRGRVDVEMERAPRAGSGGRRGEVVEIGRGLKGSAEAAPGSSTTEPAAPSVRRLARELGVDISQVSGSGPGGRISVDDVKAHVREMAGRGGGEQTAVQMPAPRLADFTKWGDIERRPMRSVRRKTAEHLSHAWTTIPHVTQHDRADITSFDRLHERLSKQAGDPGAKLTITALALKVVAAAIKHFPQFNASVDMANEEIIYKKYVHIGVAVDTDRGLLVPVVRDADAKSVIQLSAELAEVAEKARSGKLTLDEMAGGSFTITNLGGIGGTYFSPIVNAPEVAILGLSRASVEPVFLNGQFHPRLMLPLSLSYDHRAIDGADAVRFLRWVAERIEQPFLLSA